MLDRAGIFSSGDGFILERNFHRSQKSEYQRQVDPDLGRYKSPKIIKYSK